MDKTLKHLLLTDLVIRVIGLAGFTIFIGAAYDGTGRASSVGLVGLATALPSLVALIYANRLTARFSALKLLRCIAAVRLLVLCSLAMLPHSPAMIIVAAALQSLAHQVSVSTKMTLDAQYMDDAIRRAYLARKAMLSNVAVVCAPAGGGLIVGFLGYGAALTALSLACAVLMLMLLAAPEPRHAVETVPERLIGLAAALRELSGARPVAAIVGTYCVVAVLLEIQAPLIFPFVREIYAGGSSLGGVLLGLCGLGGLAGAYATEKWPGIFKPAFVPVLVLLDGLLFLGFTQLSDLMLAGFLFATLGAMGSITLILVESAVQTDVSAGNRPFVFSLMQFAGGAGGATLGVFASFLAEGCTTKVVLSGAALLEVGVGVLCVISLRRVLLKVARSAAPKVD